MWKQFRPAAIVFTGLTLLTGVAYPLAVTDLAKLLFPRQAEGSLVERDGRPIGSGPIGQEFRGANYFWGRPSATSPVPYNGGASSGSNLGPTNPALIEAVTGRVEAIRAAHPDERGPVPIDLVTASASGLDPHVSPAGARYQAGRVAEARGLARAEVLALIARHTEGRTFRLLGEPRVNVLALNLALDALPGPADNGR